MGLNTRGETVAGAKNQSKTKNTTRQNQKHQTSRCPPRSVLEVVVEVQVQSSSAEHAGESQNARVCQIIKTIMQPLVQQSSARKFVNRRRTAKLPTNTGRYQAHSGKGSYRVASTEADTSQTQVSLPSGVGDAKRKHCATWYPCALARPHRRGESEQVLAESQRNATFASSVPRWGSRTVLTESDTMVSQLPTSVPLEVQR